jgi:hypothetical protein
LANSGEFWWILMNSGEFLWILAYKPVVHVSHPLRARSCP